MCLVENNEKYGFSMARRLGNPRVHCVSTHSSIHKPTHQSSFYPFNQQWRLMSSNDSRVSRYSCFALPWSPIWFLTAYFQGCCLHHSLCKWCSVKPVQWSQVLGRKIHKKAGNAGGRVYRQGRHLNVGGREAGSESNYWTWDWILTYFLKEATPTQNPVGK